MADGFEPVGEDELLYRRALTEWFDPATARLSPETFKPTQDDPDGLSLWRAKYMPMPDAAQGRRTEYFVAVCSARDVRALGLSLLPDKAGGDGQAGHCVVPELDYARRKDLESINGQRALAQRSTVYGPFKRAASSQGGSAGPVASGEVRHAGSEEPSQPGCDDGPNSGQAGS